jgi:S1-C subfamily serine protease
MKNLNLAIYLIVSVLLASVVFASDLPPCPKSGFFHNCAGTFYWEDQRAYIGEWKGGKKDGYGMFISKYGHYVGDWKQDRKHGFGTLSLKSGHKHTGKWVNDKSNGHGTREYSDGSKYIGDFKDDKKHGVGKYIFVHGEVLEGIWKEDNFQGIQETTPALNNGKALTQDDEIISASSGSGFAVSSDGHVITNHHVIDGCQKVVVHIKGKELPVTVVTYDPQNDLALLKGDFNPPTVFPLSNTRPELLQDIYVAGFPFGDKFSTSVKVTKGIVSSLTGLGNNFSNIQIDAALQSGNSGGPILDDFGNVVAVAVAKLDAKYMFEEFGIIPENTNFGIKSSVVRSVLDSNSVNIPSANKRSMSKSQLGEMISGGTYYISCWMTMAQIEKMKTKKVFFSNLD